MRCQMRKLTGVFTDMRFAFAMPLALAAQLLLAGRLSPTTMPARIWFQGLPLGGTVAGAGRLVLLGDYYYLVDGQFGTGTYNALSSSSAAGSAQDRRPCRRTNSRRCDDLADERARRIRPRGGPGRRRAGHARHPAGAAADDSADRGGHALVDQRRRYDRRDDLQAQPGAVLRRTLRRAEPAGQRPDHHHQELQRQPLRRHRPPGRPRILHDVQEHRHRQCRLPAHLEPRIRGARQRALDLHRLELPPLDSLPPDGGVKKSSATATASPSSAPSRCPPTCPT